MEYESTGAFFTKGSKKWTTRQKWNLGMAILHGLLAASIGVVVWWKGAPFQFRVETFWRKPNATILGYQGLTNATCNNTKHEDVFEWFDCLADQAKRTNPNATKFDDNRSRLYKPEATEHFHIPVWILLIVFEALTADVHFKLWWFSDLYEWFLAKELQPFRWFEYSVTSSIMLMALMSLSRISDMYALFGFFIGSVFINLTGGLCFELFAYLIKHGGLSKRVQTLLSILKWVLYALAIITFAVSYIAIFHAFHTIIDVYLTLPNAHLWDQLFGFY
jgi:hypothetical protein